MDPKSISAFPVPGWKDDADFNGMTLRDHFTAKALSNPYTNDAGDPEKIAEWAYQIADAMLRVRLD